MSIEVKVSVENGKSRLFKVESEELMLVNLRNKITATKWEAVGSNFFFLKNGSEIDPEDESEYKLSTFKKDDGIEVVVSPQQHSDDNKTTAEDQKAAAKEAKETAKTALESQNLSQAKLNPKEQQTWKNEITKASLINDQGSYTTDDKGVYFVQKWDKLKPLLDSLKFPKALKVTSQGLEPVNRAGVELSKAISENDVENEVQISDQNEAYYTEWEKQAYKMLSKSVSASVGIPIPWLSATFGLSASYATSSESLSQSKETHLFMVAQRIVQKTKVILKEETIQVTEKFKQSVERAKNVADLRKVFQEYGYFVATTYIIGGKIIAENTETFSGQKDKTAKAKEFGAGFKAELNKLNFTASASGAYKSENQEQTSQSSLQTASKYSMTLKGGDDTLINNGTQWISSLKLDKWQIVGYEDLKPITDFLDEELKKKCEEILSTPTPINKLPIKVAEEIKGMAWNAAWYAANTRAGDKYKGDAGTNDVGFKKHSGDMSKAVAALELKLSQNALDDIQWGAWNAAWYTANTRAGVQNDAKNDLKQFEQHFESLKNSKEVTDKLAENLKNMCLYAAWHAANERYDCKQDAKNDLKQFEFYYSEIVE
ncbi:MAC/perforin domain-containing protein [Microcoleus sp. Z1_B5]|uniref:MAC/perforin domain-containing protein n=1 Tax=Microcoleus sp. Z1_B5 TaxID=3055430 RepID=UPI002FD71186